MDDSDETKGLEAPRASPLFTPEALESVHDLNGRLFIILAEESRRESAATGVAMIGKALAEVTDEVRARLARVPISLVDGAFHADERWCAVARGDRRESGAIPESLLPRARALELAPLCFGMAATTARASREAAQVIFGMTPAIAEVFASLSVQTLQWLGQARAHWIGPRWHDRPQVWARLILTAARPEGTRLPPVGIRATNQLLADLERATSAASETRRSRR